MSTSVNLWGDLAGAEKTKSPVSILKEQASQLTEMTKGLLQGQVRIDRYDTSDGEDRRLTATLYIKAPALDNYRAAILRLVSDLDPYPVAILDLLSDLSLGSCESEEEFIRTLEKFLQSDRVKKALRSLLSQSSAV